LKTTKIEKSSPRQRIDQQIKITTVLISTVQHRTEDAWIPLRESDLQPHARRLG